MCCKYIVYSWEATYACTCCLQQFTKSHPFFWQNLGLFRRNRTIWESLWAELVSIDAVKFLEPASSNSEEVYTQGEKWQGAEDKDATPRIDLQRTFMLHSILSKFLFLPTQPVMEHADEMLPVSSIKHPVAVVHRRQTDSYSEVITYLDKLPCASCAAILTIASIGYRIHTSLRIDLGCRHHISSIPYLKSRN